MKIVITATLPKFTPRIENALEQRIRSRLWENFTLPATRRLPNLTLRLAG